MLLGLHGQSRAGKDSVAAILVKNYGFRQVSLATPIRELLLALNPLLEDDNGTVHTMQGLFHDCYKDWDRVKAESAESVDYMIRLGQGARDIIGEDVWLQAAFPLGQRVSGNIVVSDIRQPNEVQFMYRHGGELWKVERPGTKKRGMDDLLSDVRFDATIVNDGTLADLEETVNYIIDEGGI